MKRSVHMIAGVVGFATIIAFWASTVASELTGRAETIALVKSSILTGMFVLIPSMVIVGGSGMAIGRRRKDAQALDKKKRMPIIAKNGLLILLPAAFFLQARANVGLFDTWFYVVQAIEIRDYRHREATRSASESILDSYSETAMDDVQTTIENAASISSDVSETDTDSMEVSGEAGGGINLGVVESGGEIRTSASSVNTSSQSLSQQVDTLNNAVSHHVQTADTQRQVEMNADVTSTETTETEQTIKRMIENINKSRLLNIVYRQLLQEFFTITYLEDVSFFYSNGFDTSRKRGTLASLDNFLGTILADEKPASEVRSMM